jgi:hypothetical protein
VRILIGPEGMGFVTFETRLSGEAPLPAPCAAWLAAALRHREAIARLRILRSRVRADDAQDASHDQLIDLLKLRTGSLSEAELPPLERYEDEIDEAFAARERQRREVPAVFHLGRLLELVRWSLERAAQVQALQDRYTHVRTVLTYAERPPPEALERDLALLKHGAQPDYEPGPQARTGDAPHWVHVWATRPTAIAREGMATAVLPGEGGHATYDRSTAKDGFLRDEGILVLCLFEYYAHIEVMRQAAQIAPAIPQRGLPSADTARAVEESLRGLVRVALGTRSVDIGATTHAMSLFEALRAIHRVDDLHRELQEELRNLSGLIETWQREVDDRLERFLYRQGFALAAFGVFGGIMGMNLIGPGAPWDPWLAFGACVLLGVGWWTWLRHRLRRLGAPLASTETAGRAGASRIGR